MKLDMVGIIVNDMAKAIGFYETLGFSVAEEHGADYMELNNQGIRISLNTKAMIEGIYGFSPQIQGEKIELAFLCQSVAEVNQLVESVRSAGYQVFKEPWDAFWGQRYGIVQDPDGNLLSLFAGLEEE